MFIKRHFFVLLFLLSILFAKATHNRAGEITYKRIPPFTQIIGGIEVPEYTYSITVTLYTDFGEQKADRCLDTLYFGDGDKAVLDRINGGPGMAGCRCSKCGEIIINQPGYGVKKNIYTTVHKYPGAGTFLIRTFDRNRNENVVNIPSSINQPFYVEAFLVITSFTGANSSPIFSFPPIDKACAKECFYHNPGAYDPDKDDSLSYEITSSRGAGGLPVFGYSPPNQSPGNEGGLYNIDPITGLLSWCNPKTLGEYNIAFIVKEWRKNTSGVYQLIGYVLRDMQVIVEACPNNDPPDMKLPADTCVEAGTLIDKNIYVFDNNNGQVVTIEGGGGAFQAELPQATLTNTSALTYTPSNTGGYNARFVWQTNCNHVKKLPYYTTFKVLDNGTPSKLPNFKTYIIKIFPPSIKNVTATPSGSSIRVSWQTSTCSPSGNPLIAYKVYRKNDCSTVIPVPCKAGIFDANTYTLVGQTSSTVSSLLDNNNGKGLVVGEDYGYIVVGLYEDGTETFGSTQICAKLTRDVPVMLNVDVLSTSTSTGSILLRWARPLKTPGNFDTIKNPGPYQFLLKHNDVNGNAEVIFTSQKTYLYQLDTFFTHALINTNEIKHEYYVEFIANAKSISTSQKASSIFLTLNPSDRKVNLTWLLATPWTNSLYTVYRKDPGANVFKAIGTTTTNAYLDNKDIANNNTYCYKIESKGAYSDATIPKPLVNRSQENCAYVKDLTPPCTPTLTIDADCPLGYVNVKWNYLKNVCDSSDDVVKYVLYYKPTTNDEYYNKATLTNVDPTNFIFQGQEYISGCYAMLAIDSSGNTSRLSPDFCVDNCPEFELPNIFTPNGDDKNDNYQAVKVRQIKEIDLNIYDRWGNLVYKTSDPYFKWDGTSNISKKQVSEGTFFYTCVVSEPRVTGLVKRTLKGFLQLSK